MVAMASIFKYKRYRRIYESGFLVCNRLVSVFNSSIGFYTSEVSIREELFGVDNLSDWEAMDVEVKAKPFMLDIARCNVLMGYRTERLDKAAMLEFSVYKRITDYRNSGYEHFLECSEDPAGCERYVALFKSWEAEVASTASSFKMTPLLEQTSHKLMNDYIQALIGYCKFVSRKAKLRPSDVDACVSRLDSMLDKELVEYEKKLDKLHRSLKELQSSIDSLEATQKRVEAEKSKPYGPTETMPVRPDRDSGDMTKDYMGRHGEFDYNDEARRISEDMQQFHNANPDADLSDHYYWDDVLNAGTDGYLDD